MYIDDLHQLKGTWSSRHVEVRHGLAKEFVGWPLRVLILARTVFDALAATAEMFVQFVAHATLGLSVCHVTDVVKGEFGRGIERRRCDLEFVDIKPQSLHAAFVSPRFPHNPR